METTTRRTIIDQFKLDLQENLNVASGYNTDVTEVRNGIYLWEDFSLKPSIAYWAYKDEIEGYEQGTRSRYRLLYFYIYCYHSTDGLTNTSDIYDMVEDVENFLESSHFTYSDDVILGDSIIYTGGSQDQAAIGQIEIQVRYKQS